MANPRLAALLGIALITLACHPIRGCAESQFQLMADSRLPKWIALPPTVNRADVSVELWYWTPLVAYTDNATIYVTDGNGDEILRLSGKSCWHPATGWRMGESGPEQQFVIISVNGIIDVVEHGRLDPQFRMSDDSQILREAEQSIARGDCRHSPDPLPRSAASP